MNVPRAAAIALLVAACRYDNGNPAPPPSELPATSGGSASSAPGTLPSPNAVEHDQPVASRPLAVGAVAPPFRASSERESYDSRAALRAGPLVLVFYIGETCVYCQRQLSALQARLGEFAALHASLWAISSDQPPAGTSMARTYSLHFPILSDPDLSVAGSFGVAARGAGAALPSVFVVAPDGHVTFAQVGADQEDRASIDEVIAAVRRAAGSR